MNLQNGKFMDQQYEGKIRVHDRVTLILEGKKLSFRHLEHDTRVGMSKSVFIKEPCYVRIQFHDSDIKIIN